MKHVPKVECECCKGSGLVPLTKPYRDAWEALSPDAWRSTAEIAARLPRVKRGALCNRLAWLEERDLAERCRDTLDSRVTLWRRR